MSSRQIEEAEWRKLLEEKQRQFQTGAQDMLHMLDLNDFTRYLDSITMRYQRRGWNRFIDRFKGSLEHIKSFERAISAMSQTQDAASLIWGSIQMVIEVSLRVVETTRPR